MACVDRLHGHGVDRLSSYMLDSERQQLLKAMGIAIGVTLSWSSSSCLVCRIQRSEAKAIEKQH